MKTPQYNITRGHLTQGAYTQPIRLNLGREDTQQLITLAQRQTATASVVGYRYEYHILTPQNDTYLYYADSATPWKASQP